MTLIDQSPFEWFAFNEQGVLTDEGAPVRLLAEVNSGATDLVVLSHGWKTDQVGAGQLYSALWRNVTQSLTTKGGPAPQKIVVAGVIWPSKTFEEDFDATAAQMTSGRPLAAAPAVSSDGDLDLAALDKIIDGYRELVGATAGGEVAAAAVQNVDGFSDGSARCLLDALRASTGLTSGPLDSELRIEAKSLLGDPKTILETLAPVPNFPLANHLGEALGLGDVISNAIQGSRAAIARLLNQFTYFTMKARAGTVGHKLGADVLSAFSPAQPVRVHLIGHSFGARLVTAAAAAFEPSSQLVLQSLTLLQGAYSQNGLSCSFGGGQSGAFASVLTSRLIAGPISISHTHNDTACTIAYPLASRLSRDISQSLGDATDLFGAMGANGAQNLLADAYAEDQAMAKDQATYTLVSGKVNRVLADACVSEHMDVTNADVGSLVASVLRTDRRHV